MKRLGVIGIIIKGDRSVSIKMQELLNEHSEIIVGRLGVPLRDKGISAISLIVEATNEELSALTGKLGRLESVSIKSALLAVDV
ncbi:MAG: CopG family transcriptional regulator [Clostridiaceae bacterium]|nr:CopG family transcriptional regulator [Clostridiaceae bacterium]